MALRVVVADDQALVRVGFCGIIAATPGFIVVGEAGNGAEAVEAAHRTRPDVILMDVRMPVMDGIEATRQITASTDVRALILTTFDLDEYVFAALRAGASGFLLKDTVPADLLTAIRVVAAGDALLAPSVTRRLIGEFTRALPGAAIRAARPAQGTATSAQDDQVSAACDRLQRVLTERELEVLRMVARGMSNAEIAEELTISPATAKTHVAHLLTKLDARDRIQLVIIAYQTGLCDSGGRPPARLVREVAPVVLEDEADRREHGEQHPDEEEPPADRETERGRGRGQTHKQRPPAMRAEEPDLAGTLLDLATIVVFRAPGQAPTGEQHVEAGQDGQPDAQRERGGPGHLLRGVPVHDVGAGEEDPGAEKQPAFDLHLANLLSHVHGRGRDRLLDPA
jgi:DNA-binding NarL/FixJ family response regulator